MSLLSLRQAIAEGKADSKLRKILYSALIFSIIVLFGAAIFDENITSQTRNLLLWVIIPATAIFFVGATEAYVYILKKLAQNYLRNHSV